jgi:hypothetical protein
MHIDGPLADALRRLLQDLESRTNLNQPVTIYIAGGMAAHLYTQSRATTDVDAEFPPQFAIPPDLTAKIEAGQQAGEILYIDTNYNPTFSLLHEDYQHDAQPLDLGLKMIDVRVLAPVDLLLSKVSRLAAPDQEDIEGILRAGLVSADEIERRGEAAIASCVGDVARVRGNLAKVLRLARAIEADQGRARSDSN